MAEKTKISAAARKDWHNLPTADWNTLTFHAYFIDMNAQLYEVEYAPMQNWQMEQRLIKSAIEKHGPDKLRAAFELCFAEYTPTREYPLMTAGFALAYMVNRIMPRINKAAADQAREATAVHTQQQIPDEWW